MMRVSFLSLTAYILTIHTACLSASAQFGLNLFGGPNDPPDPKHGKITFYDPKQDGQRGIRTLFFVVPKERENRSVDQRIYDQMSAYLGYFCQDVFTLNSFDDPTRKKMVENILVELVDQWKEQGSIKPETLFSGIPFLKIDTLILMERTHYDHVWKGDEKRLLIGMNIGAFELDFGQPLYNDRYLKDVNWFGERANYVKAEKAALVEMADNIGDQFQAAANRINQAREAELRAALEAERLAQEQLEQQVLEEQQLYSAILMQADEFLETHTEPASFIEKLQNETDALRDMLTGYGVETIAKEDGKLKRRRNHMGELTPEEEADLQKRALAVQQSIQGYDALLNQKQKEREQEQIQQMATMQAEQQKKPVFVFTPTSAGTPSPTSTPALLPVLEIPGGSIFDRTWLIPTPTPTPAVSSEGLPVRSGDLFGAGLPSSATESLLTRPRPILPGGASRSLPAAPPLPDSIIRQFTGPQSATAAMQNASGQILNTTSAN